MNNYQILGVTEIVSKDELKKAHRKLLKKYHPDKFTGDKAFAEQKTREINAAYTQILADLEKCEKQTLKAKKPQKTTEEKRHFKIDQFFASIKKPNESKEPNLDNLETAAKKEETDYNYYASLPVENNSSLVSNLYRTKEELKKEKKAKLALDITICVLTALTLTVILLIAS